LLDKTLADYAVEAIQAFQGLPQKSSIRGAGRVKLTSFMGLPCPNILLGESMHFIQSMNGFPVQDMQKAVETIINLYMVWEEAGGEGESAAVG